MKFLAADPGLVELFAHAYVEAAIAAGDLVRGEDLRAGAYEMQPIGRVMALELAIDDALDALSKGDHHGVRDALESTLGPEPTEDVDGDVVDAVIVGEDDPVDPAQPALGPGVGVDEGDVDPPPAKPRRRHRPAREPEEGAEADERGRPTGMPELDREYECTGVDRDGHVCGALLTGKAAQMSFSRFRVVLCPGCLPHYSKASGIVDATAAEFDEGPAGDDGLR